MVFKKDSDVTQYTIRNWYKREPVEYKCSICGQIPQWQSKPLTLILDHIDGNNRNNELSNLRWVCPNCNQQLETTGYKKMRVEQDPYKLARLKEKRIKMICPKCGNPKSEKSSLCNSCAAKARIVPFEEMPVTRNELKSLIRSTPFTQIGVKYNVTDNAVRKWCDKFNLPRKVSDIKKYTDEEWELL